MVAHGDFIGLLDHAVGNLLVVGALALAHHVEGVADVQAHQLVFVGVVYQVFAQKLQVAAVVRLIQAHLALGQGHPHVVLFAVAHLHHDVQLHVLGIAAHARCADALNPPSPARIQHQLARYLHVRSGEQGHLLGFVVAHCGSSLQGVQVVLEERLLLELWSGGAFHYHPVQRDPGGHGRLLHSAHVTCHQLQLRIGVGGSTAVIDGHPAGQVHHVFVLIHHRHVVRLPCDGVGDVGDLRIVRTGAVHVQLPQQRRARDQSLRQLVQLELPGWVQNQPTVFQANDQTLIHGPTAARIRLSDYCSGGIEQGSLQNLHLAVGVHLLEAHRLAHRLIEDGNRVQQVVLVVLLAHGNGVRRGKGFEADGRGVYLRSNVLIAHEVDALFEVYLPVLAHHREVLVVHCERDALCVLCGGCDHILCFHRQRCPHQESDTHEHFSQHVLENLLFSACTH
ncbi:hypothetical protein HRbin16_01239 [bacterium HR16]|nr:hypothetical protein HRbin16_01239 [bacterium HR16]